MAKGVGRILFTNHPISQIFGVNSQRYAQFGMAGHNGIDIAAPLETTVLAGVHGIISSVGDDPAGYGRNVRVFDPSQNLLLIFAHLNSIAPLIKVGAVVVPQNPIGGTGNTGNSTGPHLHFGVADTDIAGMKTNRENGFDGWKDPLDTNYLNLDYPKTYASGVTPPSATPPTTTPVSNLPAGVAPPTYAPTHAGQTVSHLGNSFRSDNGTSWIFQGTDAERAAAEEAAKKKELTLAESKSKDAGVYLTKANLLEPFMDLNKNASDFGLRDAENVIIRGPYKATVYSNYRGGGTVQGVFTGPGTYSVAGKEIGSVKAELILPPHPPEPAVSHILTGTEPWAGKKAPTHTIMYNKMVELFGKLLEE